MKKYYRMVFLLLTIWGYGEVLAQGFVASGSVKDARSGQAIPGVNVIIKGTAQGAITDQNGEFSVQINTESVSLIFTFIGYRTKEVSVSSSNAVINVTMDEDVTNLQEIVVTGMGGPVEKKKIGNTIGTISTKNIIDAPVNSFSDVIQGRTVGVVGLPSSGLTGEGAQIRIRGSASLSQLNEPIVLIDGIRVDRGGGLSGFVGVGGGGSASRLDDINPESIDRIEILKGASAATLFGTEASNGVIQIFTKKGQTGKPQFNVKLAQGIISYPKGVVPDNTGFARTSAQSAALSTFYGRTINPYELIYTNALEDLYETGTTTQFSTDVSGGTSAFKYFVSTRYVDTDGPFGGKKNRNYPDGISTLATDLEEMFQLNLNLTIYPTDKFNIRIISGFTDRLNTTIQNNNNIYAVGSLAQFSKPERASATNQTGTAAFMTVNESMQLTTEQKTRNYNGSVGLNYSPLQWLKVDGLVGVNFVQNNDVELWPFRYNIDNFSGANPLGLTEYSGRTFVATSVELKAYVSNRLTSSITSDFILGGQLIKQKTDIGSGSGQDFPGPGLTVAGAAGTRNTFQFFEETVNAGLFAQEQFSFSEQFYLTLGARLDAHSAFGSNFRAQFYPKVSYSWVLNDAPWWRTFGPISSFQLKGSYGWAGLQPGAFDALTTYAPIPSAAGSGIVPQNLGNPDLSPEVSKEWETGFNLGLFDNRAGIEFVYWDRVTEDALFSRQFAPSGGFRATQLINLGELAAHGIEITINANVFKKGDWAVDVFANGAFLKEKVVSLGGAPPVKVGGSYPRYRNFLIEGFAPGANLGPKLLPVGPNQLPTDLNQDGQPDTIEELLAILGALSPSTASLPIAIGRGGILFADEDGDGNLLDHYLGKSTPDWSGGFGGSVKWKNLTLNTLFEYRAGNYVINNLTDQFRQANPVIGRNLPTSARVERDYITGGVDGSFNPQNSAQVRLDALKEWIYSNLALSPYDGLNGFPKGDFIRWRELSLTYRFPSELIKKFGMSNASFTAAGRNIALFTKYPGVDPELQYIGRGGGSTLDQNFGQGVAAFGWPIPKQILFTLKVGF